MHIPDGVLTPPIALACWIISIIIVTRSLKRARKGFDRRKIPLIVSLAMFIFAAQLFDFPILGGTTGHFLGAAFLAILLGFDAAVIAMASVLWVQAFVLHDGGIFALGANMLNMAILAPALGTAFNRYFAGLKGLSVSRMGSAFVGSFFSVVAASSAVSLELALSGAAPLLGVFAAMSFPHVMVGVVEGLICVGLIAFSVAVLPFALKAKSKVAE